MAMKTVEWKKHVSSYKKLCGRITSYSVSSKRVIAGQVCVDQVNLIFFYNSRERLSSWSIECVSKRKCFDVCARELEIINKWRMRSDGSEEFVSSLRKRIGEIDRVTLAASK